MKHKGFAFDTPSSRYEAQELRNELDALEHRLSRPLTRADIEQRGFELMEPYTAYVESLPDDRDIKRVPMIWSIGYNMASIS